MIAVAKYKCIISELRDGGYTVIFCSVHVGAKGLVSQSENNANNRTTRNSKMQSISEAEEKAVLTVVQL